MPLSRSGRRSAGAHDHRSVRLQVLKELRVREGQKLRYIDRLIQLAPWLLSQIVKVTHVDIPKVRDALATSGDASHPRVYTTCQSL